MPYAFIDDTIGKTPISQVDAAMRSPQYPGFIGHAVDPVQGGGEFVYLQGVAGTVKGSLVTYNSLTGATVLAATGAKGGSPVAVAMAAIGAGQWGWYMITGDAQIAKVAGALAVGTAVGVTATPGQVGTSAGGSATAGALTAAVIDAAALAGDATVHVNISRAEVN